MLKKVEMSGVEPESKAGTYSSRPQAWIIFTI